MATILMGDQICAVVYVDASIAEAGDGSTPAAALDELPAFDSMDENTVYLCRRNELNELTIANSSRSTCIGIFIIGMPKFGDWLYDRIPQEAKTAWDADGDDYCKAVFAAYNARMRCDTNAEEFGMHRMWLERPTTNATTYDGYSYVDIRGNSSDPKLSVFFTWMKWTESGFDLSNPGLVTNTTYQSAPIHFQYGNSCKVENFHFQFAGASGGTWSGSPYYGLGISDFEQINFNDVDIWHSSFGASGSAFDLVTLSADRVETMNVAIHLLGQDTSTCAWSDVLVILARDVQTANITCDVRWYDRPGVTNTYMGSVYEFDDFIDYPGNKLVIRDITIDLDDIWSRMKPVVYIKQDYISVRYTKEPSGVIARIDVRTNATGGVGTPNTYPLLSIRSANDIPVIDTLTAYAEPSSVALELLTHDSCSPVYRNVKLKGYIFSVQHTALLEIVEAECTRLGLFLASVGNANVYIKQLTLDKDNWVAQNWIDYSQNSAKIFVDSVNILPFINWTATPRNYGPGIFMNNVDGVTGKWFGSNRYYQGESWNVYRDGGADASIRMIGTYSNTRYPLTIGGRPFQGLEWTPPGIGMAMAQMYVAFKGYTTPADLPKRLRVEIDVPTWVAGCWELRTWSSDVAGQWATDAESTWNNDTGLTLKRLDFPFPVENAGVPIQYRILFDWYDTNGYLYLDPLIVFSGDAASSSLQSVSSMGV